LVDELHLFVVPVVVGGGNRSLPDHVHVQLELLDVRRFRSGVVSPSLPLTRGTSSAGASERGSRARGTSRRRATGRGLSRPIPRPWRLSCTRTRAGRACRRSRSHPPMPPRHGRTPPPTARRRPGRPGSRRRYCRSLAETERQAGRHVHRGVDRRCRSDRGHRHEPFPVDEAHAVDLAPSGAPIHPRAVHARWPRHRTPAARPRGPPACR